MKKWTMKFWVEHGERLMFALLSLGLSTVLYQIGMKAEAKTIFVGVAMLFFNKVRSPNGSSKND